MSNKDEYRMFCLEEPSIPIFSRDWWLDAVCGDNNWDVLLVHKDNKIVASMPYYLKKRLGFKLMVQPLLTQKLGPWIRPIDTKYERQLSYQMKLMNALFEQMPEYDYLMQSWHYEYTNWLPLYWQGFQQTTRYTYIITDLTDQDKIWFGMKSERRTSIRKAINHFGIQVRDDCSVDDLMSLSDKTYKRQGRISNHTKELILRIDNACRERNCRKIFIAEDSKGKQHAALMIVWDENSSYCIVSGFDPDLKESMAQSHVHWEAIKYASTETNVFDFEGSMVKQIEFFFRSFGACQVPYFSLKHVKTHRARLGQYVHSIMTRSSG